MRRRFALLGLVVCVVFLGMSAVAQQTAKASGAGSVEALSENFDLSGEAGHFNFGVDNPAALATTIDLSASNPVTNDHVRMQNRAVVVDPLTNSLAGDGPCEVNGQQGNCQYFAQDRGEPGRQDFFSLIYDSPLGGNGALFGQLLSGNIEILVSVQ
jgi:hypothetical protein